MYVAEKSTLLSVVIDEDSILVIDVKIIFELLDNKISCDRIFMVHFSLNILNNKYNIYFYCFYICKSGILWHIQGHTWLRRRLLYTIFMNSCHFSKMRI